MNKLLKINKHQYYVNIMHNGIINKTKYDGPRKLMKQTSFIVKNLVGKLLEKQFTIVKKSL